MHRLIIRSVVSASVVTAAAVAAPLGTADREAAFRAAGFTKQGDQWKSGCDDPGTPSYSPGAIEALDDLNGDGQPEALVTEDGTYCYGHVGTGYSLVSRQKNGSWKLMSSGAGMLSVLPSKGADRWPDLQIGGPGFCFPVERWNGREYVLHRHEYEGKACRPD